MDAKSVEMLHNQDLIRAVRFLYRQERITKDKDIVDTMKIYKKNTVSGYIKGKIPASKDFRTKFEEVFELKLSEFTEDLPKMDNQELHGTSVPGTSMNGWGDKYVSLLEKTIADKDKSLEEKEADLLALRSAINKITGIDHRVGQLESTVGDLQGKWRDYEPIFLGLREFVTDEIASLKKISREAAAAALNIKVEGYRKKVKQ